MSNPDPDPYHVEREALRAIKAVWERAVRENDLELIRPHLGEGFSIVTFTNREFRDFGTFKAQWQRTRDALLKGGTYAVELLPDPSAFMGDLALCHGDSSNRMTVGAGGGGPTYEFGSRWTVVCRKIGGEWKIVRAHSSINPFENPLMLAGFKKKALQLAGGSLLAGLIAGVAVAHWVLPMLRK